MHVIRSITPDHALVQNLTYLLSSGLREDSRNGPVWVAPTPVTNVFVSPSQMVLMNEKRDANPFFHLFESLWMLAGRCDVAPLSRLASNMSNFSVDGLTFNAAYGHRWRNHFGGLDQLVALVHKLKKSPGTRQAVLGIWDPEADLEDCERNSKDRACNLSAVFTRREFDFLDMMVSNRSNDAVWGTTGANYVHFSVLLHFVAEATGMRVGTYSQVSANLHLYGPEVYGDKLFSSIVRTSQAEGGDETLYQVRVPGPTPMCSSLGTLFSFPVSAKDTLKEIEAFVDKHYELQRLALGWSTANITKGGLQEAADFFRSADSSPIIKVATIMMLAHSAYKAKLPRVAEDILLGDAFPSLLDGYTDVADSVSGHRLDWCQAGLDWVLRRSNTFSSLTRS
jgi:hypothetical protein